MSSPSTQIATLSDTPKVSEVEKNSTPLGHELVSSYHTNRHDDPMDLVELARVVQNGSEAVKYNAGNKLRTIADQIRYLQEQAEKVLREAKRDADLHHAACNLVKKPGTVYHLYRRPSGQKYLSILSPSEWGATCPHEHCGTYRLNYDNSWTPSEEFTARDNEDALVNKVLTAQLALPSTITK